MPCPQSPEPDSFHRFKLKPSGTTYADPKNDPTRK